MPVKKPYVNYNTSFPLRNSERGSHTKRKIVMHETVSHDREGLSDIQGIASYLRRVGYGIHLIIDQEGLSGYYPRDKAIFWHAAGDNLSTIGVELVSFIPGLNTTTNNRFKLWWGRERQLHKAARWLAYYSDKHDIPLRYSQGRAAGVCSHWDISQSYDIVGGHWDCRPKHRGGHFPMRRLIRLARGYKAGKLAYKKMPSFKLGKSV